jgi:hypothetical protein
VKNCVIVMPKKHIIRVTLICAVIIFAASIICNFHDHQAIAVLSTSMWKIEPETPKNIDDPPFELPYPTKTVSVSEVMKNGKEIPLQFAYNNPDWKRQVYKEYWHSSYGRWSYVPDRISYAMHRIFVTYPTASVFYDFTHDLGIWDESDKFQIPTRTPFENIVLVVMQTKVDKIITLGNQVVVIGRPSLNGLQVLLIPNKDLTPYNPKESILFQLVTPEGDEIDYTNDIYAVTESSQTQSN